MDITAAAEEISMAAGTFFFIWTGLCTSHSKDEKKTDCFLSKMVETIQPISFIFGVDARIIRSSSKKESERSMQVCAHWLRYFTGEIGRG